MTSDLAILAIAGLANLFLGTLVFLRNPKSIEAQSFLGISLSITAWAITNYYTDNANTLNLNHIFNHLAFASAFITVAFGLPFSYFLGNIKKKSKFLFFGFLAFIIAGAIFSSSDLVTGNVVRRVNGVDVIPGPLYLFYLLILIVIFSIIFLNLHNAYKRTNNPRIRAQIKFLVLGISVSFILGLLTNAVLPLLLANWRVAKIGPLLSVALVGSTTFAIVKHRLFDIRMIIARSVAYVLLLLTLAGAYGFITFKISTILFNTSKTSPGQLSFNIILAIVLAFTFQPLRRFFEKITDKIFYKDKYDPQALVNDIGKILASEIHLEVLTKRVISELTSQMKVSWADIMVLDERKIYYHAQSQHVEDGKNITLAELKKIGRPMIIGDDLPQGERKAILEKYGINISVALRTSKEFIGFLLVGEKSSGDIYNETDLKVLRILGNELAVAVQNAKAYAEIQRFNETLQAKITAATKKLRAANHELTEIDIAKDEFISMASHQLRTPLTTVKGYVSMMLDGDFGPIAAEQKQPLTLAFDNTNRMARLISDLLNVSRIAAGRFFIDAHDTDLNVVVKQEVEQLQSRAQAAKVKLSFEPPSKQLPLMNLDEDKTRQVIMNLVDNALYYTPGGQVRVTLGIEANQAVVKVTDNGIGVPEAQKAKLFTKFFRADNAQNTRPDGTGLGLYLVKRVVEDQGGSIIFSSSEGHGSTFGFRLPIKKAMPVKEPSQPKEKAYAK